MDFSFFKQTKLDLSVQNAHKAQLNFRLQFILLEPQKKKAYYGNANVSPVTAIRIYENEMPVARKRPII